MTEFALDRPNVRRYQDQEILAELRRVAEIYQRRRFTRHDFDKVAAYCKGTVVLARFGSWRAALDAAGLVLVATPKDRSRISNAQLFQEMERIWRKVGHRPSKDEWEFQKPQYSYTTYKTRFGGWLNACAAFIELISDKPAESGQSAPHHGSTPRASVNAPRQEDRRAIPAKLRYRVLVRDNFRCVLCGRSPALETGVRLHIDHIVPFARDGKTVERNLRTLCESCNWGKGDEHVEG